MIHALHLFWIILLSGYGSGADAIITIETE